MGISERIRPPRNAAPSTSESPGVPAPTAAGAGAIATAAAILVYILATGVEIVLIRWLQPTQVELAWISDAILSVALGLAVFLWLHLKWMRMTLSSLERAHIVLEAQLSLAAEIQRGLLPPVPIDEAGVHWAARLVQAGRIGGDVYDFVRLPDRTWLVLVGDVSGKGVPAALLLASIHTMFRMLTAEVVDPGALAERISQRLYEDHRGRPYLTCIILRIDLERREIAYVNAGHPAGIVVNPLDEERDRVLLASCGPPAGLFAGQTYRSVSLRVPNRAVAILVTDGITEAFDILGLTVADPIATLLAQLPRPLAPRRLCDALIERTANALASGDWQDDRTVVAVAFGS